MGEKEKRVNLPDEELNEVVGGFRESNKTLSTYGMNIVCPVCKSSDASHFSNAALKDSKTGSVEYHCSCGTAFVCYSGQVILKAEWIKMCKDKGYNYPFV